MHKLLYLIFLFSCSTNELNYYYPDQNFIPIEEIKWSSLQKSLLKEGSHLIDLQTNETKMLLTPLYVKLHRMADAKGFKYIVDKNKKMVYKTHISNIIDVTDVTTLDPSPENFIEYNSDEDNNPISGPIDVEEQ